MIDILVYNPGQKRPAELTMKKTACRVCHDPATGKKDERTVPDENTDAVTRPECIGGTR